ncbi:MAG: AAA family ATPase [Terriglobales bacterium]
MAHSVDDLILRHFGLRENPFGVTPDPRFLYMSGTHREALASLVNGIECGFGFQVLVAQPGMGKTTLLFDFLERFKHFKTAFLFQQQHDPRELLQSLLIELKCDSSETSQAKLYSELNHLLSQAALTRDRVIVVVDEAQNLEDSLLETLRQLSNFETARSKLLQIVLSGQPQLAKKLARPEQQQLRQRISSIARLSPLGVDETRTYLSHRLNVAGHRGAELFTMPALQLICSNAHGIPRNINTLCFNSMLLAFAHGAKRVDEQAVEEAASDLDLDCVLADLTGSHRSLNGLQAHDHEDRALGNNGSGSNGRGDRGLTSVIGRTEQKPNGNQHPAIPPAPTNGHARPAVAEAGPPSISAAIRNHNPATDPGKYQEPRPLAEPVPSKPVTSNPTPRSYLAKTGSTSRAWKNALWISLIAVAMCAGVLFGHGLGLGSLGQRQREEPSPATSEAKRADDVRPVLDAPATEARNQREPRSGADDDPEVIVRTFPSDSGTPADNDRQNVKTIFFGDDSAVVSNRYDSTLQIIAEILAASPQSNATIEGHTDSFGEEPYNIDLSARRAFAVKNVLVNQYQIADARLTAVGAGSTAPLQPNSTSTGRAYNRRVEVRITQAGK